MRLNTNTINLLSFICLITLAGCTASAPVPPSGSGTTKEASTPDAFIAEAEKDLKVFPYRLRRAGWIQTNFITEDTEALAAEATKNTIQAVTELAEASRRFDSASMSPDTARKISCSSSH